MIPEITNDILMYGSGLVLSFTALFLGLISPGPSVLAILSISLGQGRRPAILTALGVGMGTTTLAAITVTGLSALIATSAQAFFLIKIIGGCYLIYLAYNAFRSANSDQDYHIMSTSGQKKPLYRYFLQGLMIHLTNPKALFVWLAIAAMGIQSGAPTWVPLVLVIGACILSCSINVFGYLENICLHGAVFSRYSVFSFVLQV